MIANTEETISCLNELIKTCKDGEEGFRTAVAGVQQFMLKEMFRTLSSQRAIFARELQSEVRSLGGTPESSAGANGTPKHGWNGIKNVVAEKDETAVVAACERGENSALDAYSAALKSDLPLVI